MITVFILYRDGGSYVSPPMTHTKATTAIKDFIRFYGSGQYCRRVEKLAYLPELGPEVKYGSIW